MYGACGSAASSRMLPSKPRLRNSVAAVAAARPPPTMTMRSVMQPSRGVLGTRNPSARAEEGAARGDIIGQLAAEQRGDQVGVCRSDPAERHTQVLRLDHDT